MKNEKGTSSSLIKSINYQPDSQKISEEMISNLTKDVTSETSHLIKKYSVAYKQIQKIQSDIFQKAIVKQTNINKDIEREI